jgi:hypothetical protein
LSQVVLPFLTLYETICGLLLSPSTRAIYNILPEVDREEIVDVQDQLPEVKMLDNWFDVVGVENVGFSRSASPLSG